MRNWKWLVVAGMLLVVGRVEAQCSPNPCYAANQPGLVFLTPQQAANLGAVTVTLNLSASDGSLASHKMSAGAESNLRYNWSCGNANSLTLYTSWDGGSWTLWQSGLPCSGSGQLNNIGPAGHILGLLLVGSGASGATSQDLNNLTITSDSPGIVKSDQLVSNRYAQINSSGGGGSMLNDFTQCQNNPRTCINATHTPYTTLTLSNITSGEVQSHAKHVSGNVASANQSVSFSDSIMISVQGGDEINFSEEDDVECSVAGPVPPEPVYKDIEFEVAIVWTYISALTKSNGWHPQSPFCSQRTSPPDDPGPSQASPNTASGEVASASFRYREVDFGKSFTGLPWLTAFAWPFEDRILPQDMNPPDCTNYDAGFHTGKQVFPPPGLLLF